ncbi:hypothetical protein RIF29_47795 [Crotalaria pallida]|uniref:Uncharacterized protein n=1 Tax=Crotalaria pallida TaxID=3830 RepID=A0AAN9HJU0_CROPI
MCSSPSRSSSFYKLRIRYSVGVEKRKRRVLARIFFHNRTSISLRQSLLVYRSACTINRMLILSVSRKDLANPESVDPLNGLFETDFIFPPRYSRAKSLVGAGAPATGIYPAPGEQVPPQQLYSKSLSLATLSFVSDLSRFPSLASSKRLFPLCFVHTISHKEVTIKIHKTSREEGNQKRKKRNWAMFPEGGRLLSGQQSSTSSRLLYDGLPCILGSARSSTLRPSK